MRLRARQGGRKNSRHRDSGNVQCHRLFLCKIWRSSDCSIRTFDYCGPSLWSPPCSSTTHTASQSTRRVAAVARIFLRISSFAQPQPWQGTKDEVVGAATLGTIALLHWLRINCSPSDIIGRDFARASGIPRVVIQNSESWTLGSALSDWKSRGIY